MLSKIAAFPKTYTNKNMLTETCIIVHKVSSHCLTEYY